MLEISGCYWKSLSYIVLILGEIFLAQVLGGSLGEIARPPLGVARSLTGYLWAET